MIVVPDRWSCIAQWERFKDSRVMVSRPKIQYDTVWSSHVVFAARATFTDQPIKMWHQRDMALKHKTSYLKLLCLPFCRFHFFSAHIKIQLLKHDLSASLCYVHIVQYTVHTRVVAKFIRFMLHSVTCNDLISLKQSSASSFPLFSVDSHRWLAFSFHKTVIVKEFLSINANVLLL